MDTVYARETREPLHMNAIPGSRYGWRTVTEFYRHPDDCSPFATNPHESRPKPGKKTTFLNCVKYRIEWLA